MQSFFNAIGACVAAMLFLNPAVAGAAEVARYPGTILYGAAYYEEYAPYDRLDADVEMMKSAGINVVRIGESTWGTHGAAGRRVRLLAYRPRHPGHGQGRHRGDRGYAHLCDPDVARPQVPRRSRHDSRRAEPLRPAPEHGHHQSAFPVLRRARHPPPRRAREGPAGRNRLPDRQRDQVLPRERPGRAARLCRITEEALPEPRCAQPRLRPRLLEQSHQRLGGLPVHRRRGQRQPHVRLRRVPARAGHRLSWPGRPPSSGRSSGRISSSPRTSISTGAAILTAYSPTWIISPPPARSTWLASTSTIPARTT